MLKGQKLFLGGLSVLLFAILLFTVSVVNIASGETDFITIFFIVLSTTFGVIFFFGSIIMILAGFDN